MTDSTVDRLTVEVTMTGLGQGSFWPMVSEAWRAALEWIPNSGDQRTRTDQNLWASGADGFDVRTRALEQLVEACAERSLSVEFVFLNAKPEAMFGISGVSLFSRPGDPTISLTVRGYSRATVEETAWAIRTALLSSREWSRVSGGRADIAVGPIGVSTTASLLKLPEKKTDPVWTPHQQDWKDQLPQIVDTSETALASVRDGGITTDSALNSLVRAISATGYGPSGKKPTIEPRRSFVSWLRQTWVSNTTEFVLIILGTIVATVIATILIRLWLR